MKHRKTNLTVRSFSLAVGLLLLPIPVNAQSGGESWKDEGIIHRMFTSGWKP